MFTSLIAQAKQMLAPIGVCWVCRCSARTAVCGDCQAAFAQPRPRCTTCARALPPNSISRCGACLSVGSTLDSCHTAVDYAYPWDGIVQRMKYSDHGDLTAQPALARVLAQVMRASAQHDPALAQALQAAAQSRWIIPIALHPDRQRERGFNQAVALARALFPDSPQIRCDLLLRIRNTPAQAHLAYDARAHNLQNAFIAAPLAAHELAGASVTLIDDVCTTTATLSAAQSALRKAGAVQVHALVFARAVN